MSTWIMLLLVFALAIFAYMKDPALVPEGLEGRWRKLSWAILPAMVLAFIVAEMVSVILPRELMTRWLGEESDLRAV
ncbi:MAG: hypothetical protein SWH68_01485 [Thermodesulfobacteriota bacterium]|nr:hypothetical protein [Thermodesulfobacteriota bacterium]